jgi:hypothetical protein
VSNNAFSCGCINLETMKEKLGQIDGTTATLLNNTVSISNSSGFRGVSYDKSRRKFAAQIGFKRKQYHLGRYSTPEEAAEVRKIAEQRIWGDFLEWYNNEYRKKVNDGTAENVLDGNRRK